MNLFLLILIGISPPGDKNIICDLSVFSLNDSTSYTEFIYFISPDYLKILKKNYFDLEISVSIFDKNEKKVVSDSWKKRYNFKSEDSYIADIFTFILKSGEYKISIKLKTKEFEYKKDTALLVPYFSKASISDIQIFKEVSTDKNKYPFKKYSLSYIPSPFFSHPDSFAYYYFEIYSPPPLFFVYLEIKDSLNNVWLSNIEEKKDVEKASFIYGKIPIYALEGGKYSFKISLLDTLKNLLAEKEKKFTYFSLRYLHKKRALEKYEDYLSFIDFFASKEEMEEFKKLEGNARITFLKKFWSKFDPDPSTPVNEFLVTFTARVEYADQNFGTPFKKGRYTDRGRIYIKYGPPDEVRRNPYPVEIRDWESWFYKSPSKNQYIFMDLKGNGDYILIYSSNPEEPGRSDWKNYVPLEEIEVLR
ncbi:MAG: GWxTD domain-containing protein [candidate division WOR-3 bacterium]